MDWSQYLDEFGRTLLRDLGEDPDRLPGEYNPILRALEDAGDFVAQAQEIEGFSRVALSRMAVLCQMAVFDHQRGPEQDGKCKGLRRHWYSYFKTKFAQPLAFALGDYKTNGQGIKEIDDRIWAGRLSETYGAFVDTGEITYKQMWVEDASRMMAENWQTLFSGCHIIIAVEKDSLFSDFVAPAKALGARAIYSGKGKSSKAAIEKCLRDHFYWSENSSPFSPDSPLIILHISDYDYDGEQVIGPTFGEQAHRYTDCLFEARVGIEPDDVTGEGYGWDDKWYSVKVSNKGYQDWANVKALFMANCLDCGHQWPVMGTGSDVWHEHHQCPRCKSTAAALTLGQDTPHGFEVEALPTRSYYGLLVDALLTVLPFDYIVGRLRDECQANAYNAVSEIAEEIFKANESYQALLAEFDRLEAIKQEFEDKVKLGLQALAEPHKDDWRDLEDDPEPGEYRRHVQEANDWSGPWWPFSEALRTEELAEWVKESATDTIEEFESEVISW